MLAYFGELHPATLGAFDLKSPAAAFEIFLDAVPGCYAFVGSANPARGLSSPHHSPEFDFDEAALEIGAELLAQSTLDYLLGTPRPG